MNSQLYNKHTLETRWNYTYFIFIFNFTDTSSLAKFKNVYQTNNSTHSLADQTIVYSNQEMIYRTLYFVVLKYILILLKCGWKNVVITILRKFVMKRNWFKFKLVHSQICCLKNEIIQFKSFYKRNGHHIFSGIEKEHDYYT